MFIHRRFEVNVRFCRGQGPHDCRDAGTTSIVHAARAHHPLAVKLIAGRGAGDERRRPRPGRLGAVDVPGSHSGQAPNPGTTSRTAGGRRPWIIQAGRSSSERGWPFLPIPHYARGESRTP